VGKNGLKNANEVAEFWSLIKRLRHVHWQALIFVRPLFVGSYRCLLIAAQRGHASLSVMRPLDIQPIGQELAIKWDDGGESFIALEKLRRSCPCAGCKGERDIMGNLYKNPDKPLPADAFRLLRLDRVGGYAVQPVWADGHQTGLFSFDYLKHVADEA
jgi:DUF971 family protein